MTGKTLVAGAFTLAVLAAGNPASAQSPKESLSAPDRQFVMEASEGGRTEVDLGELAQQKASNDAVRQFAQRMIADHGKAGQELARLAASKGVELTTQPSRADQREKDQLTRQSGPAFDREYVKMMVKDHEQDVAAFRKMSRQAKDRDLKEWVSKTLPVLEDHLKTIRQIEPQLAKQ